MADAKEAFKELKKLKQAKKQSFEKGVVAAIKLDTIKDTTALTFTLGKPGNLTLEEL